MLSPTLDLPPRCRSMGCWLTLALGVSNGGTAPHLSLVTLVAGGVHLCRRQLRQSPVWVCLVARFELTVWRMLLVPVSLPAAGLAWPPRIEALILAHKCAVALLYPCLALIVMVGKEIAISSGLSLSLSGACRVIDRIATVCSHLFSFLFYS